MANPGLDLAKARVLISNDDGIDATGLKRLEKIVRGYTDDVWVVAPEREQSASSHSLTLRRPLRMRRVSKNRYAVDGTPTDCVLLAINRLLIEKRPDLVLSGINRGGNLGEDTTYSGTIAAAMEATLFGIPAIALSQCSGGETGLGGGVMNWTAAERYAGEVIAKVVSVQWPRNVLMSVNFPPCGGDNVIGIEVTREGRRKLGDDIQEGRDPRGDPYFWLGAQRQSQTYAPGTDLDAVNRGAVAITPLSMDMTHRATIKSLSKVFA